MINCPQTKKREKKALPRLFSICFIHLSSHPFHPSIHLPIYLAISQSISSHFPCTQGQKGEGGVTPLTSGQFIPGPHKQPYTATHSNTHTHTAI